MVSGLGGKNSLAHSLLSQGVIASNQVTNTSNQNGVSEALRPIMLVISKPPGRSFRLHCDGGRWSRCSYDWPWIPTRRPDGTTTRYHKSSTGHLCLTEVLMDIRLDNRTRGTIRYLVNGSTRKKLSLNSLTHSPTPALLDVNEGQAARGST